MSQSNIVNDIYEIKRYWYHVSSTLKKKKELLKPRDNTEGFNRPEHEPNIKRICVSPTLEQCLTAIPYSKRDTVFIYRTNAKVIAKASQEVFDSPITQEGWILKPTWFIKMGVLDFEIIPSKVITEAATMGMESISKRVLNWWLKLEPWKYVK
jgi:hypothetical protein